MKQSVAAFKKEGIQYRKGIFIENPEYNVLTILEMKQEEKEHAIKKVTKLYSKNDVEEFVKESIQKAIQRKQFATNWSYSVIDMHGRALVLRYKGVEIALFYQRQLTKRRISQENPVSELKLKDPKDAWVRCDLWGLSTQQNKQSTVNLIQQQEKKLEQQERTINTKQALIDQLESNLRRYQKKRRGHKHEKPKKKKREAKSKRKHY